MNKYTIEVKDINPMETAPVWDYYDGNVDTIILFVKWGDFKPRTVIAFYNRDIEKWCDSFTGSWIQGTLLGWLPDYKYVGIN